MDNTDTDSPSDSTSETVPNPPMSSPIAATSTADYFDEDAPLLAPPSPMGVPGKGRVPTSVSFVDDRVPHSFPKADNAIKREHSRKTTNTMRAGQLLGHDDDRLERLARAMAGKGPTVIKAIVQAQPLSQEPADLQDLVVGALIIGGSLLVGYGIYKLFSYGVSAASHVDPAAAAEAVLQ